MSFHLFLSHFCILKKNHFTVLIQYLKIFDNIFMTNLEYRARKPVSFFNRKKRCHDDILHEYVYFPVSATARYVQKSGQ